MVAVVALAALGNVLLMGSLSESRQVVAAAGPIERGALISRDALVTVQVGTDPALSTVPGAQLEALVGQRAAVDIPAGTLLTAASTSTENVPGEGFSLVGVAVPPSVMPGVVLLAGDRIRVVSTPGPQGVLDAESEPASVDAVVVSTSLGADLAGVGASTIITVQVPDSQAAALAALAATGRVAVVLDSRDR